MRWIGILLLMVSSSGARADAPTPPAARCESAPAGREKIGVTCAWQPGPAARRYRFAARFTGSHDDTRASLTLTLDGLALRCEPDSKISLEGEDGDVSLHCSFPAAAQAGKPLTLRALVSWHHAQYTHFEFRAE